MLQKKKNEGVKKVAVCMKNCELFAAIVIRVSVNEPWLKIANFWYPTNPVIDPGLIAYKALFSITIVI